jgi:hypothetical protein
LDIIDRLSSKRLCFSVTSGRSGTKLLAELLRKSAGLVAEHEPAPRFNYVLPAILICPEAAGWWLSSEKLPAILERVGTRDTYAELSHLTCKGFIEPMLELGLRPAFVIISRSACDVAKSLFRLGVIPERTGSGRLVLMSPKHSQFLPFDDWEKLSDYQLCYWYAREIEFRQAHFRSLFERMQLEWRECSFEEIASWESFVGLARFVSGFPIEPDEAGFSKIIAHNQNSREGLLQGDFERSLPPDIHAQERNLEDLIHALAGVTRLQRALSC